MTVKQLSVEFTFFLIRHGLLDNFYINLVEAKEPVTLDMSASKYIESAVTNLRDSKSFMNGLFTWIHTPEGDVYWRNHHHKWLLHLDNLRDSPVTGANMSSKLAVLDMSGKPAISFIDEEVI